MVDVNSRYYKFGKYCCQGGSANGWCHFSFTSAFEQRWDWCKSAQRRCASRVVRLRSIFRIIGSHLFILLCLGYVLVCWGYGCGGRACTGTIWVEWGSLNSICADGAARSSNVVMVVLNVCMVVIMVHHVMVVVVMDLADRTALTVDAIDLLRMLPVIRIGRLSRSICTMRWCWVIFHALQSSGMQFRIRSIGLWAQEVRFGEFSLAIMTVHVLCAMCSKALRLPALVLVQVRQAHMLLIS